MTYPTPPAVVTANYFADRYGHAFTRSRLSFWKHWRAYHYHGAPGVIYGTAAFPFLQDAHIEQLAYLARRMAHDARKAGLL